MKNNLKIIVFLLFFICFNEIKGQAPTWYWAKNFGGVNYDEAKSICTDKDGNIYVVGTFRSSSINIGGTNLVSYGYEDIFLVKLSSNGNVLWAKSGGGQNSDNASSVGVDDLGNVYITGHYASSSLEFDNVSVSNNGSYDAFIAKFDSNGNIVWLDNAGGSGNEYCTSLKVCDNGNIYVTGYFNSSIAYFGDEYYNNVGAYDYFILHYTDNGLVNHVEVGGGAGNDYANDIDIDKLNNINLVITSNSDSLVFGNKVLKTNGMSDMFLIQYNLNFENNWAKSIGGTNNDFIEAITTDLYGNIFITGSFLSNEIIVNDDTIIKSGSYDVFVGKFRNNSDFCWMKAGVGLSADYGNTIKVDNNCNIYIGGNYKVVNNGNNDAYIAKFDSTGLIKWANNLGSLDDEFCYDMDISSTGEIYITGSFISDSIVVGNSVLKNNGYVDLFVAKLGNDMSLTYTSTDVICSYDPSGQISINVTGGDAPYTYKWSNGATTKDITGLIAGVYTVTVTDFNNFALVEYIEIKSPGAITITPKINTGCFNMNNGSIEINIVGGTPDYSYIWTNGATTKDITGLIAGVYNVTVTDNNNCVKTGSYTITSPSALSVTLSSLENASCNLSSDGNIYLTVSGGTKAYTYLWSNGILKRDLTNIKAGTYFITVKDANNCIVTDNYTISEPPALQIKDTVINISCFGYSDGEIKVEMKSGTGPYNYTWSNGKTTKDIAGLYYASYTLTVSDPTGCSMLKRTVNQPKVLSTTVEIASDTNNNCLGTAYVRVFGGEVPYTYQWDDPKQQTVSYIKKLCEGSYIISITDFNGCHITDTANVPNVEALSVNNIELHDSSYLTVFPNPVSNGDDLNISSSKVISKLLIYDKLGRCVYNNIVNTKSVNLNIDYFESGLYNIILNYQDNTSVLESKIIIKL